LVTFPIKEALAFVVNSFLNAMRALEKERIHHKNYSMFEFTSTNPW
jgi:hypothetical protein